MTELEELREALRADYRPSVIDIGVVVTQGTRLRRRRRLAVSAAAGLTVAAVLVGATQLLPGAGGPGQGAEFVPAGPPPAASALPTPSRAPSSSLPTGAPDAQPEQDREPLGEVIDTRFSGKRGAWVLYAVRIDDMPGVGFGVMLGHRLPGGRLSTDVMANEVEGADRSPGFHAVQGSMEVEAGRIPMFGYYAGPAVRITAVAGGKTVTARLAAWSEDPSVKVFWFDPALRGLGELTAYDEDGRKLPTGNNRPGVG